MIRRGRALSLGLLLLLLPATFAPASAQSAQAQVGVAASEPWWDERWHFRVPLTLTPAEARDPMTREAVSPEGVETPLLLVPVDLTAAIIASGDWPIQAGGRPQDWTLDASSLRLVVQGEPVPARFFPFETTSGPSSPYDPSTHAAGTMALLLPGRLDTARQAMLYFDIAENGAKPSPSESASERARLEEIAGLGPFVSTLAHVPPTAPGSVASVVILAAGEGATSVRIERLTGGSAGEVLGRVDLQAPSQGTSRLDLPYTEAGYDIRIVATRPILALLDATASPRAAFFHAALDGTAAGRAFLVPGPATLDLVGTATSTIVARDARTGAETGRVEVRKLTSAALTIPAESTWRLEAGAPFLAMQRGASGPQGDAFLHAARALTGAGTGGVLIGARAGGHAATAETPANAQAYPLARPQESSAGRLGEATRPAWVQRVVPPAQTEPWAFTSAATLGALLGSDGYAALPALAGLEGLYAVLPSEGSATPPLVGRILAPFAATSVELGSRSPNGTLLLRASTTLAAGGALALTPDGESAVLAEGAIHDVETGRPTFRYVFRPGAAAQAALPGLPVQVQPTTGRVERHGALLSWHEPSIQVVARPGESARATLTVRNLGRALDGSPLVEGISLEARSAATGGRCAATWEPALPVALLESVPSPGERSMEVHVSLPEDAKAGECVEVDVTARSSADPDVVAMARVSVRARSGFVPELRILRPDGNVATSGSLVLETGEPSVALLRVRNLGGENGTARLAYAPGPGYESALRLDTDGAVITKVDVPPDGEVVVRLEILAPTGSEPAWDFFVQATSDADPSLREEVIVSVAPRSKVSLTATPDDRRIPVTPDTEANTTLRVQNLLADVEVRPRLATTLPEGWNVSFSPERVVLRARGSVDDLGAPLDEAAIRVVLRAPAGARVGETHPLALALDAGGTSLRVPITAVVTNDFHIEVDEPATLVAGAGDRGTVTLVLRSSAAGDANVSVRSVTPPRGWTASVSPRDLTLRAGEFAEVTLRYQANAVAPAGPGILQLALRYSDNVSGSKDDLVEIPTVTAEEAVLRLTFTPALAIVVEGERVPAVLTVRNDGNAPTTLALAVEGAFPIELPDDATASQIAPGATRVFETLVGPGAGTATIRQTGGDAGASASIELQPAKRDLRMIDATLRPTGNGTAILDVEIKNAGNAAVPSVVVRVAHADGTSQEATLAAIAAGDTARHAILVPTGGALRVEVEGGDGARDPTPEDNVRDLPTLAAAAEGSRATPGGTAGGALFAVLTAFGVLLASRPGRRRGP